MKIIIRNYRKVSSADIDLSGNITLLAGKNGAGKSSALDAVRCVVTAAANPFKDITKKQASMLVHAGTPSGFAELIDGDNKSRIDWPECKVSSSGTPVLISDVAAGIRALDDMTNPERNIYITNIMHAEPTEADLIKELIKNKILSSPIDVKTDFFIRLWSEIEANGWNNTFKLAKEKGIKKKGIWEDLSGCKKYGLRIAEQWAPAAWSIDLETLTEAELIGDVKQAEEWVTAATRETAVSEHEAKELKKIAGGIGAAVKSCQALEKSHDATETEIHKKLQEVSKLESVSRDVVLTCPTCNEKLTIKNNKLIKFTKKGAGNKKEIDEINGQIECLRLQKNTILTNWKNEAVMLRITEAAVKKLAKVKPVEHAEAKIEDTKNRLILAESRLKAFQDYKKARKIAGDIVLNQKLCAILAPDGLRNKKLTSALGKINKSMKMLTDPVNWPAVELNPACDILVGGVPFGRLLAKSERYRARILLQLMAAMAEKSAFVIIDDADELTSIVRNQLFNMLLKSKIKILIAAALSDRADSPAKLADVGGRGYWIEDGKIL